MALQKIENDKEFKSTYEAQFLEKINQIVDAVNGIESVQEKLLDSYFGEKAKTQMEEQNWIGKLCFFWDDNQRYNERFCYGVLSEIDKGSAYPYCCQPSDTLWEHCKPIKADSEQIYKGK